MALRRFTVAEAEELLPRLELEFRRLLTAQEVANRASVALGGVEQALAILKHQALPQNFEAAEELMAATAEIVGTVERINAEGCLIKDIELAIVDFPGEHEGREVHFCWQFGEPRVLHYHSPEEPDAERRPLFEKVGELLKVH